MSVSSADFWKLLSQSRLLTSQQVQQLTAEFGAVSAAPAEDIAKKIAEQLVARSVLSRYQAAMLAAGKSGPFFFGDYKIQDRIAQGRLTGHFRAIHTPTGHPVLLRFLTGPLVSDPERWSRAAASAKEGCKVSSPYVQRFFEVVDTSKIKFLVSEDLRGKASDERLTTGRFPAAEACRIARLAALGLAQMHDKGRIHGDLRPANILLEPIARHPGNVKLLWEAHQPPQPVDWAKQEGLEAMADYLAPELMTAGQAPNPQTDIYALGCTLYAILAGTPPFAGGAVQQKMTRHATEAVRPLESLGVPKELAQVVAVLMAKKPVARLPSAAATAEKLAAFVDPAALAAQPPAPPATLASYEQHLRQRPTASATKSTKSAPAASSPVDASPAESKVASLAAAASAAKPDQQPAAPIAAAAAVVMPAGALAIPETRRAGLSAAELIRRRAAAQRKTMVLGLVGASVVAVVGVAGGAYWFLSGRRGSSEIMAASTVSATVDSKARSSVPPEADPGDSSAAPADNSKPKVIADDGKLLWASPTSGGPVSFRCVPPDAEAYLIVRPADLVAYEEGGRVLAALGPAFAAVRKNWEAASGVALGEVEQLIATLHADDGKAPKVSFVVKTKAPFSQTEMLAKWGNPAEAKANTQTYYTGAAWAYYIPSAAEDARTFVMGDAAKVKEVAQAAGAAPLVFRDIERLRRALDDQRHCTLLFYPQFLCGQSQSLFGTVGSPIREAVGWLCGNDMEAAAVSFFCGEECYLEMRALPSLDKEPQQLADEVRTRLNSAPQAIESYIDIVSPPTYWSRIARRYPLMIGQMHQQLRFGVERDQPIINAVLPGPAAHNLVLGGELLVSSTPPTGAAVTTVAAATPTAKKPQTIEETLQLKTTYNFENQSLEFAMRDLAEDVSGNLKGAPFEFVIKILGDDLKLDGITRNQSIRDFKQENQTVADILTALVRKANPVTTVKDPSETDQKLIWVIGPDPENASQQIILITTRTAAGAKKYKLPAVFVGKKT